ncbi:hypothetical protein HDZ31DRAFT_48527 [Schizophyllum fasciatum]
MFPPALALLASASLASATAIKALAPGADALRGQTNWTLNAVSDTAVALQDAPAGTPSNISASLVSGELKMSCPFPDYHGVLVPVEGTDPVQYTLEFAKVGAELAAGSIADGWTSSDLTDDLRHPDLKKLANSKAGKGVFDVTSANFDFPALTFKPVEGEGYAIVIDYAHDITC